MGQADKYRHQTSVGRRNSWTGASSFHSKILVVTSRVVWKIARSPLLSTQHHLAHAECAT
jgi:hypothetical protein